MNKPLKSLLLASSVAAILAAPAISTANSDVEKLTQNPANWATWGGNYAGTRYSELNEITADNVKNLQPAWTLSTGVLRGGRGGVLWPLGGVIYIHTPFPNTVFAIDQKTQAILWEFTPVQDADVTIPVMCCDTVNRGLAYGDGKIFLQQSNTVLTALDAKTGKRVLERTKRRSKIGYDQHQRAFGC